MSEAPGRAGFRARARLLRDKNVVPKGPSKGYVKPMADLEQHAFKRDRRFIVRLVLMLSVATLFGLFVYSQLTSRRTAGCAADTALGSDPKARLPSSEPAGD
jgi:hypothetical protein